MIKKKVVTFPSNIERHFNQTLFIYY